MFTNDIPGIGYLGIPGIVDVYKPYSWNRLSFIPGIVDVYKRYSWNRLSWYSWNK